MNARRGFTLLELVLASALSVVLMMGILAVLTDMSSDPETLIKPTRADAPATGRTFEAWAKLLRDDMSHTHRIESSGPNRIVLRGSGALDARGRSRTHRPVELVYELRKIDGRTWLVRRQRALDVLSNRNVQRDLVCTGIEKFELSAEGSMLIQGAVQASGESAPPGAEQNPDRSARGSREQGPREAPLPSPAGAGTASPGQGPDQPSPPEGELRTLHDPSSDEVCIMINGLWYYPRYAPRWAQEQYRRQSGQGDSADTPDAGGSGLAPAPNGGGGGSEGSGQAEPGAFAGRSGQAGEPPAALSITWRLRIWTNEQAEPAYDRVVAVQLGGAR